MSKPVHICFTLIIFKQFNFCRFRTSAYTKVDRLCAVFRLDALALSVIATATCLAGWVAGCPSHSGIVTKRLNLSDNFLDHLQAPSL